ncbi:PDCD5-related protein [Papiliotrema laurentii]|uniref:PDCD5-related protein n=1 Tax=Papiliotrema laurentii TaxID=5418 RepID=A0AAD9FN34_PAPLA|nr:PDCD5-related protein [Papiliotrema laurentii]
MSNFQLPAGFKPSAPPAASGSGGNGQSSEEQQAAMERAAAQEEMKRGMISAMLEPAARERLSRISLTRPQMAQQVTELLVRMGQQGQIRGKVTDEALKGLLEQVSNPAPVKSSTPAAPPSARTKTLGGGITIQRKADDSDSDEYDL